MHRWWAAWWPESVRVFYLFCCAPARRTARTRTPLLIGVVIEFMVPLQIPGKLYVLIQLMDLKRCFFSAYVGIACLADSDTFGTTIWMTTINSNIGIECFHPNSRNFVSSTQRSKASKAPTPGQGRVIIFTPRHIAKTTRLHGNTSWFEWIF